MEGRERRGMKMWKKKEKKKNDDMQSTVEKGGERSRTKKKPGERERKKEYIYTKYIRIDSGNFQPQNDPKKYIKEINYFSV